MIFTWRKFINGNDSRLEYKILLILKILHLFVASYLFTFAQCHIRDQRCDSYRINIPHTYGNNLVYQRDSLILFRQVKLEWFRKVDLVVEITFASTKFNRSAFANNSVYKSHRVSRYRVTRLQINDSRSLIVLTTPCQRGGDTWIITDKCKFPGNDVAQLLIDFVLWNFPKVFIDLLFLLWK